MYIGVSSSCSRKTLESKSSKVKDKHAKSAPQQLLSCFNGRMEKQVSWLYALDNLEFSRSKIITNGPTVSELRKVDTQE